MAKLLDAGLWQKEANRLKNLLKHWKQRYLQVLQINR
jgi:hypothetical protein